MTGNPLSARAIHDAGFADPRSTHRERQSPGCACYWCTPHPCQLCGLSHTNPSVNDGCLDHALRANGSYEPPTEETK